MLWSNQEDGEIWKKEGREYGREIVEMTEGRGHEVWKGTVLQLNTS